MNERSPQTPARSVRIVALGCAKNLVDTERVAGGFKRRGWRLISFGPSDAVVVTTCGFIAPSAQESVNTLLSEIEAKKRGETQMLVAAGCLPERYREGLVRELEDLDLVVGVPEMSKIPEMVDAWFVDRKRRWQFASPGLDPSSEDGRVLAGPFWSTYLKIADGCDNRCAYCTIPNIRGTHRSVPMQSLLDEAAALADAGVLELSLVAQDIANYGIDLYGKKKLPELLEKLSRISGLAWIRLLYAHPAHIDKAMIDAIAGLPKVAPYLDLPMQHASDDMLWLMRRKLDKNGHERLLRLLRERIPGIALRTTMMVGFPGETRRDFEELTAFVAKWRFDHLGAFAYCREEETPAFRMTPSVHARTAAWRLDRLMRLQQSISAEILAGRVGQTVPVLVEEELAASVHAPFTHSGRSIHQAPEVDGVTYLTFPDGSEPRIGEIVRAKITGATPYDLQAQVVGDDQP